VESAKKARALSLLGVLLLLGPLLGVVAWFYAASNTDTYDERQKLAHALFPMESFFFDIRYMGFGVCFVSLVAFVVASSLAGRAPRAWRIVNILGGTVAGVLTALLLVW
jgi:DMSO reductase anchor subunit